MPYDELGNFYGDSDIPNSPPTTDLDAMKLALENQQVRQKSLQNRSTPESYNRTQQALSLLPGQLMPNGQSPMPVKPPKSTATNIPQALLDVSGASALPQTLLSMGTGYAEALAKGMGLDDVADKLHYEPTSKYANDINEALGNLASKTGPLPELMFMGKNRTVTPSDVQVLGARAIETGRQLKRLPEDFQASQEGLTRLGADNEPTIGTKVQKGFESFGDYLARTEGKPRVTIGGMDLGSVVPDTKLYAVEKGANVPLQAPIKDGMYSKLDEIVMNLPQEKGSGEQMLNMVKSKGVKEDELAYRGFENFLKEQPKVTKQQMLEYLKENPIDIGDKKITNENIDDEGEPNYDIPMEDFQQSWNDRKLDRERYQDQIDFHYHDNDDMHDEVKKELAESHGVSLEDYEQELENNRDLQREYDSAIYDRANIYAEDYEPFRIKHGEHDYEIFGDNYGGDVNLYHEGNLLGSHRDVSDARYAALEHAMEQGLIEPEYEDVEPNTEYTQYRGYGKGVPTYEEHLYHYHNPDMSDYYDAPHFKDSTDLMMHQRMQDATTKEGKSALKIEEQQSDQHQKARERREYKVEELIKEGKTKKEANELVPLDYGYLTPQKKQEYIKLKEAHDKALTEWNLIKDEYFNAKSALRLFEQGGFPPDPKVENELKEIVEKYRPVMDAAMQADTNVQNLRLSKIPDAPLKKSYNEYLMKKALYQAALKGKDKLVWTTGKTQAQRYNKLLQENIQEIHYKYDPDKNSYEISFVKPDGQKQAYRTLPESDLKDHLGSHIADQMKANKGVVDKDVTKEDLIIENPDLPTDQYYQFLDGSFIVPFINKLDNNNVYGIGKTIEEAHKDALKSAIGLPKSFTPKVIKGENISIGDGRGMVAFYDEIQAQFLNKYLKRFGVQAHKDKIVDAKSGQEEIVNAIDITPEMKKEFLERGQPSFKKGGVVRMQDGGIAERANQSIKANDEQKGEQSIAPFSLFGMTSPTDPRIPEGSGLPPTDMGLLHVGHNELFDNGNLSLGATGISMATPQGRINKLSGVDVGFEHPSGIYGRINKPIGGQSPRYEVGYRKSFADGGVANMQNSSVFDTMGNYAGMDTSMPTTQPTQPKVDNFEQAMNVVLPMEGGYNNVKGDSPTNYGIKQNTYSQYLKRPATVDDVRNMPIEHAKEIYRQNYWNPLQADSLDVKPAIVAFDAAVNQGLPFAKHIVKTTNGDIEKMLDMRQQRYNQSAKNPTKARFKKGWDNRLETIKNYALEDYYQDGGEVKKKFPTPEFQKLYEDMVLNAKPDPNTQTVNERLGRQTVRLPQKPTVGLQPIGSGFGGSDGAKGTQLHLFEKKGGKVVSLAKMRAELNTRNR